MAAMVRLIRGIPVFASLNKASSVWETLPGPSSLWNLSDLEEAEFMSMLDDMDDKRKIFKHIKRWLFAGNRITRAPAKFAICMDGSGFKPN